MICLLFETEHNNGGVCGDDDDDVDYLLIHLLTLLTYLFHYLITYFSLTCLLHYLLN